MEIGGAKNIGGGAQKKWNLKKKVFVGIWPPLKSVFAPQNTQICSQMP